MRVILYSDELRSGRFVMLIKKKREVGREISWICVCESSFFGWAVGVKVY